MPTVISSFGVPTPSGRAKVSTRTKHRRSRHGRSHAHVPVSRWTQPGRSVNWSLPPPAYDRGPFTLPLKTYDWRFWAVRGDEGNTVLIEEIESVTWDDSSAVMTGSLTFRTPEWADKLGIREGHEIMGECSDDDGRTFTPLWRMRLDAPSSDIAARQQTANLVNDLNRLQQSDDDFVYAAEGSHPGGWRVDQVIRDIAARYEIDVAYCPVMNTRITKWHLTDQRPLDVINSALIREKNMSGLRYAVSLDARGRLHVTPFRRPRQLLELGPQLIAATLSGLHDPRFATAVTVRSDLPDSVTKDKKGHRKVKHNKIAVTVTTPSGVKLYGLIHRNLYSPDANSGADARHEGALFLHEIAKLKRQFTVTTPGMPFVKRLDAVKFALPDEGFSQVVYVTDARHTLDGTSGYQTEIVLDFDDPYIDHKALSILNKLSDSAVAHNRKSGASKTKTTSRSKASKVHQTKAGKPVTPTHSGFGVPTPNRSRK